MGFGFQYKDGITRSGINHLCIVGIYTNDEQLDLDLSLELDLFLNRYGLSTPENSGDCNQ